MNNLRGTRVEYHILQSFPVTCLNRDDVGAPKTAWIGGVERARVSSQCWKRQVRMALRDLGIKLGVRTKDVALMLAQACEKAGATHEQAEACGLAIASALTDNTLFFFSNCEADAFAAQAAKNDFKVDSLVTKKDSKITGLSKELKALAKSAINPAVDGLDIALFGRMVAQDPDMNMQAAASFAHAISTHKANNEVEFFTALDDLQNTPGSAHMGTLEYNSATYYRYISLDLGQLYDNLRGQNLGQAVDAFTRALYLAVPEARQTTQTGLMPWDYARVLIRKGQGMQVSFENPVRASGGFLAPSQQALDAAIERNEKLSGSLYGLVQCHTFGIDTDYNIDRLARDLADYAASGEVKA